MAWGILELDLCNRQTNEGSNMSDLDTTKWLNDTK
jgi:hypothetical protein